MQSYSHYGGDDKEKQKYFQGIKYKEVERLAQMAFGGNGED